MLIGFGKIHLTKVFTSKIMFSLRFLQKILYNCIDNTWQWNLNISFYWHVWIQSICLYQPKYIIFRFHKISLFLFILDCFFLTVTANEGFSSTLIIINSPSTNHRLIFSHSLISAPVSPKIGLNFTHKAEIIGSTNIKDTVIQKQCIPNRKWINNIVSFNHQTLAY